MEKQILLKEPDYIALQRKADAYDKNQISITFRINTLIGNDNKDREIKVFRVNEDSQLISPGQKDEIEHLIKEVIKNSVEYEKEFYTFKNRDNYKDINSIMSEEYSDRLNKIPVWIRKFFNAY